jgi:hypothetical protein
LEDMKQEVIDYTNGLEGWGGFSWSAWSLIPDRPGVEKATSDSVAELFNATVPVL